MKNKALPVLWEKKEECCGCSACASICPKGAISMKADKEGFLYPFVEKTKCIACYMCLQVCAFKYKD